MWRFCQIDVCNMKMFIPCCSKLFLMNFKWIFLREHTFFSDRSSIGNKMLTETSHVKRSWTQTAHLNVITSCLWELLTLDTSDQMSRGSGWVMRRTGKGTGRGSLTVWAWCQQKKNKQKMINDMINDRDGKNEKEKECWNKKRSKKHFILNKGMIWCENDHGVNMESTQKTLRGSRARWHDLKNIF